MQNPEQGEDFEMIDTSEEEAILEVQLVPKKGRVAKEVVNRELDPHIINSKPHTVHVE